MGFHSQTQRSFWSVLIQSAVFDVILVACIAFGFAGSDDAGWWFVGGLAFLWLTPFLLGARSLLFKTVRYFLGRREFRETLLSELRANELPASEAWFNDASAYFDSVANDEEAPKKARRYAGIALGQLGTLPRYSFVDTLTANALYESALQRYFQEREGSVQVSGD